MDQPTNAEMAAGFRQLADLIEATPDIPVSYPALNVWCFWGAGAVKDMAALTRAALRLGAKVDKNITDSQYNLSIRLGPITATSLASRNEVCERVVVGTRKITETVPDPAAAPVPMVERTRTEDVVEWRCVPLLAGGGE
jgi:hypothetical protein